MAFMCQYAFDHPSIHSYHDAEYFEGKTLYIWYL